MHLEEAKELERKKSFGEDFLMAFLVENVPKALAEAMSSLDALFWNEVDALFWNEVARSEFDSIM